MNQHPAITKLQQIVAEQDEKHRKGQDEVVKTIIAIIAVLISFISTSFSKESLNYPQLLLIKISLIAASICLLLSVHRIYNNHVYIHAQAIEHISNTLQNSKTAEEALKGLGSLSISHGKLYKYSMHVIVGTFCLSILALSVSALL